jgi:hypothetical protein
MIDGAQSLIAATLLCRHGPVPLAGRAREPEEEERNKWKRSGPLA